MIKRNKFIHWLKMWDHEWIPNPFYSPSHVWFIVGQEIINNVAQGRGSGNLPNITSLDQIKKSAKSIHIL